MRVASQPYLAELAEEFLAGQMTISWADHVQSGLRGETTWIDPTETEPGVDVGMNYKRLLDGAIEIEVVAYGGPGGTGDAIRRVGVVRP
ncbi:MAG: hypothetical protein HY054_10060 [Proteobacteria bacterium]|nr:hypothetical protein [Pseudomonadota bacterium]